MQAISGAPYTLNFDFMQDGEYVVPDDGSVTYTLYDNAGAAVSGQTDVAVDTTNTTDHISITIADTHHTVAGGKDFEQRTVRVSYKLEDRDYMVEQWYYVTGILNFRVRPIEVVALLGIQQGEVLIDEIDLVQAYFKVASAITPAILIASLASGGIKQIKANEAIKISAALDLARVIELKAFRKFGNELNYARFDKIDFASIRSGLNDALSDALSTTQDLTVASATLFTVTNPTNPLTG